MKHKKIRKKFILYLDGELPEIEKIKIEEHLAGCQSCRNALRSISELWNNEKIERVFPPESLWYKLKERLEGKQIKKSVRFNTNRRLIFNTAAAVVLVIISVFAGSRLGNVLNPSVDNGNKIYSQSSSVRDEFGINYFDALPPNSIAEDVFLLALNTEGDKK